ncbi:transporter [Rhodoferax sp.]|uniref:SphA family protein n=1 Tax=Rhodoferax sp. TaxID=50421 RepID=UPI0025E4A42B|nr:transporter [Rhodoferax sp.]MCM2297630.1 transporter [Rhodoferax sp.]
MKKIVFAALTALASVGASAGGHYVPGVEGIQAASVPPPGMYYLGYLVNYSIDELRAPGSSNTVPLSNTGTVSALANRFVYITNTKVLGADYGMEAIVPVLRKSLNFNAPGISDSSSGVGDIYLGPLVLGWHGGNWDAVAAAGLWFDNASSDTPSKPGNGYKSAMLTGGATYYFDPAKTWTGSALFRYEMNSTQSNNFKPGNQLTMEWGFGKSVGPVQLGLVGYDQWQTSNDSGTGATADKSERHAIGVEVVYPLMKEAGVMLKAAYYDEYSAKGGSVPQAKGSTLRFTFVKAF